MKRVILILSIFLVTVWGAKDSSSRATLDTTAIKTGITDSLGLVSLNTRGVDIHTGLALLAENNGFTLRLDTVLSGTIDVDIENTKLPDALNKILSERGLNWRFEKEVLVIEGGIPTAVGETRGRLLEVRGDSKYRIFSINYPRFARKEVGASSASISSSSSGEAGKFVISSEDEINFWKELEEQLQEILGEDASIAVNRGTGTIYISNAPTHLLNAAQSYIEIIVPNALQQVEITARIYEVTLRDDKSVGVDWQNVASAFEIAGHTIMPVFKTSLNGSTPSQAAESMSLGISNGTKTVDMILSAVKEQGDVQIISQPQIVTLNNQPALVKVGTDIPYFSVTKNVDPETGKEEITEEINIITVGVVLSVTPQISNDGWITLGISPIVTDYIEEKKSTFGSTAPTVDIKQSSSMVRVKQGSTVRISGLIKSKKRKVNRQVPLLGRIPILGHLFRWDYETDERSELVVFITPRLKN